MNIAEEKSEFLLSLLKIAMRNERICQWLLYSAMAVYFSPILIIIIGIYSLNGDFLLQLSQCVRTPEENRMRWKRLRLGGGGGQGRE